MKGEFREEKRELERIDESGARRDLLPEEVARLDQAQAHFEFLTGRLLSLRRAVVGAVSHDDVKAVGELTTAITATMRENWPNAEPEAISYIMYLLHLVEQARDWTQDAQQAADNVLRELTTILAPDHPLFRLPEFADSRGPDFPMPPPGPAGGTYVTGAGQTLDGIHPPTECEGTFCVIHNPLPGPWSQWPTRWSERMRLMLRVCPHGRGHIAAEELLRRPVMGLVRHEHAPEWGCSCVCDLIRAKPVLDAQGQLVGFEEAG